MLTFTNIVGAEEPFPAIVNTQNPTDKPPTPAEMPALFKLPPGFEVTLFAGDPDVQQPIAMNFDARGRLWVAESYTYSGQGSIWDPKHRDRLVFFTDENNDGKFDKRTQFWDQGQNLSGVTVGMGGVWALCAPHLLFIPDRNGDDIPDGPPEVMLDGWVVKGVGHNIVNGLTWGPDGWLYGRHGIQATSKVGTPETPVEKRIALNCSIWRFHPQTKAFEVVCQGTTNPWGFDYDDNGEMWFTNNVIGHLWHVIPGAHFKRMYGEDLNPYVYDLLDQHAAHYHWDAGKSWTESRAATGTNDQMGGGHSHCGGMIYLGDNWPAEFRNRIFMCNTHGRRLNEEILERHGNGYIGRRAPDMVFVNTPWFRGIDLKYGPDGGVYITDWVDLGECHDHDGVHRTSGRIYKVTYGKPKAPAIGDVTKLSNGELVELQLHPNDWFVRMARLQLQERAARGDDVTEATAKLRDMATKNADVTRQLRAVWTLYAMGKTTDQELLRMLDHKDEHMRVWGVRLLVDKGTASAPAIWRFEQLAKDDPSGLVRLYLASALQKLPLESRWKIASALLAHSEDAGDHNQPLMLWWGIEPLVPADPARAAKLLATCQIPQVRKYIARRLTSLLETSPQPLAALLSETEANYSPALATDVVNGMADGLKGWSRATPPDAWAKLQPRLNELADAGVKQRLQELNLVFGDGRALDELRKLAFDSKADGNARRVALKTLIAAKPDDLLPMLKKAINDRTMVGVAAAGLGSFDDPQVPGLVIGKYGQLTPDERPAAIDGLTMRPASALTLLNAIAEGKIARSDLSASQAQQIQGLKDAAVSKKLSEAWGDLRQTSADKAALIAKYRPMLSPEQLRTADKSHGRALFTKHCATCHKLFGQGLTIGPDLTGANRDNLDYLLVNMVDPSAVVPVDFKTSVLEMTDGRVLTGVLGTPNGKTITLQTPREKLTLERDAIETIQPTGLSLMPEGLFQQLSEDQVKQLIAYLQTREQVPLPTEK